ncbi:hypothetical protein AVEN_260601-1 [Araneus ventricosus]|uniref:Uncharacterized protein n=1 Tax=Araneus ventricosus TaxID=182803 RepID=A0A4Y2II34_ARAVE|nr:hypothetical protein AVEN_260601-1 [Araneus ventricosus]
MESSRSLQKFQEVDTCGCPINCQQIKELHFSRKNSPRRPKPPESCFCRTGVLRRNRAHRIYLYQLSVLKHLEGYFEMDIVIWNLSQMTRTSPELAPSTRNFHKTPTRGRLTHFKFNAHQAHSVHQEDIQ